ncbi:hypothetical protein HPB51_018696 [Rhipicephalus microplus]|uniref:Uncharacterized protein n=1 Tax=Rhipicephalus microplus TaxID=6941 RepID=A0A9J6DIG1_RHIMP|nr:hypothetical protein HPB51_018696 [Rhipicephalus microplus]
MVPNHREEPSESSRRTMSVSPRAHISSSGSSVGLTRKPSKRRHHKKSSKSRSSKGPKRTKFSSPYAPQRRLRRHPSAISQSRFCPHRREPYSGQLPAGGLSGLPRNHPLLVPSISSFYPPGASPLAPGTPVNIPGLPPLIAGNPVPLPPGLFPPSPFMGLSSPAALVGPMIGGGAAQQPIVLPFPIPMPMPMSTSGGAQQPIVIPAPPPPPPSYPAPMPYPVSAPVAQGGGGSDNMALMMMMKAMQQERQAATQQRQEDEERRQEEKQDAERRARKKEKEEEKKKKKKEKEEERKRKKSEREKALEERKKEIEKMQEENKRQIEEAQKKAEEAVAKRKAEKEAAQAKKAAEEEEAKKKKEEEEKAKKEAEAKAAASGAGDSMNDPTKHVMKDPTKNPANNDAAANAPDYGHPGAAGEEHPLLGIEDQLPQLFPYQLPPAGPMPAFNMGPDVNPALQVTQPGGAGRILCFILLGLVIFLVIFILLLYFFAPHMLPFLSTNGTTTAAATSAESEGHFKGEIVNIDVPAVKHGKGAPTASSSTHALTLRGSVSSPSPKDAATAFLDMNTIEIALNDRNWAGAKDLVDSQRTDSATTSSAELKREPYSSSFPSGGVANGTSDVSSKAEISSSVRTKTRRPDLGNQGNYTVAFVTTLTLGAFLDQGYQKNLKARLFAGGQDDADKKPAFPKRPPFDYGNIWNDDDSGDDSATSSRFTFEASTKSPIRELLERVQGSQHRGVRQTATSRGSLLISQERATREVSDANVVNIATVFTTESETEPEGGITLEDFKLYTIAHVDRFKEEFEKVFKELKNATKKKAVV